MPKMKPKPIDAPRAWGWEFDGVLQAEAFLDKPNHNKQLHKPERISVEPVHIIRSRDFRRIMRENREAVQIIEDLMGKERWHVSFERAKQWLKAARGRGK